MTAADNPRKTPRDENHTSVSRTVGRNVLRLRQAQGLSGRALSAKVQANGHRFSYSSLNVIETGRHGTGRSLRAVTVDELTWLAQALGVAPIRLLDDSECPVCHGSPPPGFICGGCGVGADRE